MRKETGGVMLLLPLHCSVTVTVFASSLCCIGPAEEKDWREFCEIARARWEWINNIPTYRMPSFAVWSRICCSLQCYSYLLHWGLSLTLTALWARWTQCAANRAQHCGNVRGRKCSCSWNHLSYSGVVFSLYNLCICVLVLHSTFWACSLHLAH